MEAGKTKALIFSLSWRREPPKPPKPIFRAGLKTVNLLIQKGLSKNCPEVYILFLLRSRTNGVANKGVATSCSSSQWGGGGKRPNFQRH
jgi:hypothetical protein